MKENLRLLGVGNLSHIDNGVWCGVAAACVRKNDPVFSRRDRAGGDTRKRLIRHIEVIRCAPPGGERIHIDCTRLSGARLSLFVIFRVVNDPQRVLFAHYLHHVVIPVRMSLEGGEKADKKKDRSSHHDTSSSQFGEPPC